MVRVLRNIGKRSRAKSYQSVSLLSVVSKIFQKQLMGMQIISTKVFSHSTADRQQLYLIEFIGLLIGLGPLEL